MPQQSRKLLALAALLALASENVSAFTPSTLSTQRNGFAFSSLSAAADDVSIDYDSAAKLAYDDWRSTFGKGDFSESKFAAFKSNYVSLTVANVKAAKKAREEGGEAVEKLELNDFADMTVAEYQAMQDGGSDESTEEDSAAPVSPLQVAMDAMQAQEAAANAIGEAAAAIAEEEQKLMEQLGLDSVEELEEALDAMDGVAPDGGELDTSISREARVRSSYMEWCKEYGKETDESRFPTFSSNYLAMESYAKENGKTMQLNKYADCTEEEYIALTTGVKPAVKKAVAVVEEKKETKVEEVKAEEPVEEENTDVSIPYDAAAKNAYDASNKSMAYAAFKAKYEADAVKLVKSKKAAEEKTLAEEKKAEQKTLADEKKAEEKALADEKKAVEEKKKADAAKKVAAEAAAIAKKKEEEAAKSAADIEKEKQARQAAQEKARAAAAAEAEDAAIAAARELANKEAAQVARRRELDAQAADQARQRSQKTTTASAPKVAAPAPAPVAEEEAPAPAPVAEKKAPSPPKALKKPASTGFFGNIFGGPKADDGAAKAKAEASQKEAAAAAEAAKKQADAAAQKDAETAAAAAAAQKQAEEEAATKKQAEEEAAKAEAAAAVKAKAEAAAAKKQADAAAAKKKNAAKKEAAPLFGGFFASENKPAPKAVAPKAPTPPPAETAKKADVVIADPVSDAFASFFGAKPAAPKDEPAPAPAPAPAPTPPPAKTASFNFFGGAAKPAAFAPEEVESEKKAAAKMAQQTLAKAKPGATISLSKFFAFGGAKKEAKAPPKPPTLSKWYQNNDGSITGEISGSNSFEEGELVTTSPIEGKPGKETVVVTVSGSRYFLDTVQGQKPFFNFGAKPKAAEPAEPVAAVAQKPKPVVAKKNVPTPAPAPAPAPEKPAPFNIFGGAVKPAPKEAEPAPAPAPAPKPAFSFFGGAAKPAAPAVQKTTTIKKPAPARRGTISLGSPQAKETQQKAASSSPAKNDGIPVLKSWSQEADGSITGNISNSKVFRVGQKITTSPVPKGAKPGSVVTTSSGSKYRLN